MQLGETTEQRAALLRILAALETGLDGAQHLPPVEPSEVHLLEHLGRSRTTGGRLLRHQMLERRDGRRVAALLAEGLGVLLEGAIDLAEVLLVNATERVTERGAPLARRAFRRQLALVQRDEIAPARRGGVEALERGDRGRVHAELEDLLVGGDRAIAVLEGLVADARFLVENGALRRVIGRDLGAALQDLEQRLVLATLFVELLEGEERASVVGTQLEDPLVVLLRERGVREVGPRHFGDAERERDLLLLVENIRDHVAIELDQVGVGAGSLGESLGMRDPRRDGGVSGGLAQRLGRVPEGLRGLRERALGDLYGARIEAEPRLEIRLALDLDVEDAYQLGVMSGGLVERPQDLRCLAACVDLRVLIEELFERRARGDIRRIERERLAIGVDGGVDFDQPLAPHVAELGEERDPIGLGARRLQEPELGLERLREVGPLLGLLVELHERAEHRAVGAEVVEHRAIREDRLWHVRETVAEGLRGADHQRLARFAAVGLPLADAEHVDERAVIAATLVEPVESGERLLVGGIVLEPGFPGRDRRGVVLQVVLEERAEARVQLAPHGDRLFELHLDQEHIREVAVLAARHVDSFERPNCRQRDGRVVRREIHDLPVDGLGAIGLLAPLVDLRDLGEELGARLGRLGVLGGDEHHLGGVVETIEPLRDLQIARASLDVARRERQQARVGLEGALVVGEALVAQLGDAPKQIAALDVVGHELEADLEDANEVAHLLALGVDALQDDGGSLPEVRMREALLDELACITQRGVGSHHLFEVVERRLGIAEAIHEQRSEPQFQVRRVPRARERQASLEEVGEVLPALLPRVELVERVDGLIVTGLELEDSLVVVNRLVGVAGDLLGDDRDLGEEVGAAVGVLGRAEDALVEGLEIHPAFPRGEDLLQADERALVRRIAREDTLEIRRGPVDLAEHLVEERGGALGEVDLHVRGQAGLALLGDRLRDGIDELLRAMRLVGEDTETIPQLELRGRVLRGARHDVEGPGVIAELLLHLGEAKMERKPVGLRRRGGDEHGEDVTLLRPRAGRGVGLFEDDGGARARLRERHQLLDDGDHLRVVGGELEGALGGGQRLERLLQRAHVEPRQLDLARDARSALLEIALLLEDLGRSLRVTRCEQKATERPERADVTVVEPEDLAVERDRLIGSPERLLFEERPLGEHRDARLGAGSAVHAQAEEPA